MRKYLTIALLSLFLVGCSAGNSTLANSMSDNARRDIVRNLASTISKFYIANAKYPTEIKKGPNGFIMFLGDTTASVAANADELAGDYCYGVANDGFILGVKLSSGNYFDLGPSANKCSDSRLIK